MVNTGKEWFRRQIPDFRSDVFPIIISRVALNSSPEVIYTYLFPATRLRCEASGSAADGPLIAVRRGRFKLKTKLFVAD